MNKVISTIHAYLSSPPGFGKVMADGKGEVYMRVQSVLYPQVDSHVLRKSDASIVQIAVMEFPVEVLEE